MITTHSQWNSCFTYAILVFLPSSTFTYNLDVKFPILYQRGSPNAYFGFSVGLLRNNNGYRALITAPRANSSTITQLHQPGVLFNCNILLSGATPTCVEVVVDKAGNSPKKNYEFYFSYENKQDDMWLGVSMDIQRSHQHNDVVVCGHLWKDRSFDYSKHYSVNGVCYVIDADLNTNRVQKLVPFVDKGKQIFGSENRAYYAFAQGGTSVTFSEDGRSLLIGSPGFFDWSGNIVSYRINPSGETPSLEQPIIPDTSQIDHRYQITPSGYTGYSVTTGKFYNTYIVYSAVGAPRDGNQRGRVYIFEPLNVNSRQLVIFERKEGLQLGGYFGASVSGIDLNADGFTDLLVGAPLYSEDSGGDEGRVYVYISNGVGLRLFAELDGRNKPDARFGTCIGDTGDLNQDGFNDAAVGAPYEDERGAVYIYHGTPDGINTQYVQRIAARDISSTLTGFGISISRGLDIDDNFYPDLLIGSYSSSSAVLLRTFPVIHLSSVLVFRPSKINRAVTDCDLGGEKYSCFNVNYCFRYFSQHALPSLGFQVELEMDSGRDRAIRRGFFNSGGNKESSVSRKVQLHVISSENCFQEIAYINSNVRDEIIPIQISLRYNLDDDSASVCGSAGFSRNCPVIDPSSPTSATKLIPFQVDCGPDDICKADLIVGARVLENTNNRILIIGKDDILTLDVTISNRGEAAYSPVLSIYVPNEIDLVKHDLCDIEKDQQKQDGNITLRCELGNSIKGGHEVNTGIKIDLRRISVHTSSLNIYFKVKSVSEEINAVDNELNLPILLKAVADIRLTGVTEEEQISYTEEMSTVSITHKYYVMNYGPSPVDKVEIVLQVPIAVMEENDWVDFLTFTAFDTDSGSVSTIPTRCNNSHIKINRKRNNIKQSEWHEWSLSNATSNLTKDATQDSDLNDSRGIRKRSVEENATTATETKNETAATEMRRGIYVLDCQTAKCVTIFCVAGPFRVSQTFTRIIVSADLNITILNTAMESWEVIEFTTKSSISMSVAKVQPEEHEDEISVKTVIMKPRAEAQQTVENWIIFVSIGSGIILLLIILIVLIKVGFFKRQKKSQLKRMMFQASLKDKERKETTLLSDDQ